MANYLSQIGNNLSAFGAGLQGRGIEYRHLQMQEQQQQMEIQRRSALKQLAEQYAAGQIDQPTALKQYAAQTGDMGGLLGTNLPAALKEWNAYSQMTPEQKKQYLTMKRANPYLDLGDELVQPDPLNPGSAVGGFGKGVGPSRTVVNGQVVTMPPVPGAGRGAEMGLEGQEVAGGGAAVQNLPLSAEDQQKMREKQTKAKNALGSLQRQSESVLRSIGKAKELISGWSTGYGNLAFGGLPNTDARALNNELLTIKANLGFDKLQQMRDNSPTGGALGQVSEFENRLLQAVNGALDPLERDQLTENLAVIEELYPAVMAERQAAYESDFGAPDANAGPAEQGGDTKRLIFNPATGRLE